MVDKEIIYMSIPKRQRARMPSLRTQVRNLKRELESANLAIKVYAIHLDRARRQRDSDVNELRKAVASALRDAKQSTEVESLAASVDLEFVKFETGRSTLEQLQAALSALDTAHSNVVEQIVPDSNFLFGAGVLAFSMTGKLSPDYDLGSSLSAVLEPQVQFFPWSASGSLTPLWLLSCESTFPSVIELQKAAA